ncbi:MAG: response regulator [Sporomusaceae bacterium]|nr:response regulator [Sporomusaceae bacterium]
MNKIKVLIVEDDPMVSHINKQFTESVENFTVVGLAKTGHEALDFISQNPVDLIILDLYLPQLTGLETLDILRKDEHNVDIIVISAADDTKTITKVLRRGVIAYIEKPFQFERYQAVLERYREFFYKTHEQDQLNQADIDILLVSDKKTASNNTPKNFSPATLDTLVNYLSKQTKFLSAEEVASDIGISRGTIRRYLEYLVEQNMANKTLDYSSVGRPINRFKLSSTYSLNKNSLGK